MLKRFIFMVFGLALLAGCGSGSGATNGTLTVNPITATDLTGGAYSVMTTAVYTPASGATVLPNTEISYTATFVSNNTVIDSRSAKLSSDATGTVTIVPWKVTQLAYPVDITITATTGGLSSTQIARIPAVSPMTVTPQAVSFVSTSTAGAALTVAVSGGISPYAVSSATPADISATISGTTVTLTKLTASGVTQTTTTVTVTDANGNQQTVNVGYYK